MMRPFFVIPDSRAWCDMLACIDHRVMRACGWDNEIASRMRTRVIQGNAQVWAMPDSFVVVALPPGVPYAEIGLIPRSNFLIWRFSETIKYAGIIAFARRPFALLRVREDNAIIHRLFKRAHLDRYTPQMIDNVLHRIYYWDRDNFFAWVNGARYDR